VETIKIWNFEKAPATLKALCPSGTDPEWIAYIPAGVSSSEFDAFLSSGDRASIIRQVLTDGSIVYFGSAASARDDKVSTASKSSGEP